MISMNLRRSLAILCSVVLGVSVARAQFTEVGDGTPGPVKAPHLTVELTSLSPQMAIGGTVQAGLVMSIEEHWHVYWFNAGDSGEPPLVKWTLPPGITAGPMQFPAPQRLPLGPLMDYGYEDQVAYPILLTASPSMKPGKVHLDAHVTWLVCASQCLPGKAHLGLDVDVVSGPLAEPPVVGALGESIGQLPQPAPAAMQLAAIGGARQITISFKTSADVKAAQFFPFDNGIIDNASPQPVDVLAGGGRIWLTRGADPDHPEKMAALPKSIHGVLKLGEDESYDVTVPITPGTLPDAAPSAAKAAPVTDSETKQTEDVTLFSALGLAFLGGILLNLMPCVFPVLFLKGLALVHSSNEERGRQRLHGITYTAGILVSFWAIVAVLLILRATGRELGWGFQLQSPGFVAVLAALIFFLALSLAGQFEIGLSLTSAGGELAQKQGLAGSFFTGVLATVVATPCMAPLMGAAIGFALAQPAWLTFLVFTALGLGLALPYLALSMQPQWTSILPRPGAWMEVLKQLTAVPLFATAVWLTWVYGNLYAADGVDRTVDLLLCYLILAIAGWALGRWPARWGSGIAATVLILCALAIPLHKHQQETLQWVPYTTASLEQARATGRPVFVDFTAAWCLSCQVNERAVLHSSDVDKKLLEDHFILVKADWTKYDPEITEELGKLHRSGVPTYAIYPPGKMSNADVLPELLTKEVVLRAIDRDAKGMTPQ
jgi:thiol:disulfide interchange protein/DsbC/DsbD-like thiol-disulfide interchange protein